MNPLTCEGWSLEIGFNCARRISAAGNSDAPSRRTSRGEHGVGVARLGTISISESETIMCGRVRLSSDYSEIKIRLKFAPNSVAPNFEPDWNKPPTAPMLVAIRSIDGERIPKMMKWGLIPHWAKDDKLQYSTFNARAEEFTTKPAFRGCLETRPAVPRCH
jgi:hypothetical protein